MITLIIVMLFLFPYKIYIYASLHFNRGHATAGFFVPLLCKIIITIQRDDQLHCLLIQNCLKKASTFVIYHAIPTRTIITTSIYLFECRKQLKIKNSKLGKLSGYDIENITVLRVKKIKKENTYKLFYVFGHRTTFFKSGNS